MYVILSKRFQKPVQDLANLALFTFAISQVSYAPFFILIPGIILPQNVVYSFLCSTIAGIWTFYEGEKYFIIPKLLRNSNVEALKLLHETDLRLMLQASTILTTLVSVGILTMWFNALWPSIPEKLRISQATLLLQALFVLQILYLIVGIWFGYFSPILDRLEKIRAEISKRNQELN